MRPIENPRDDLQQRELEGQAREAEHGRELPEDSPQPEDANGAAETVTVRFDGSTDANDTGRFQEPPQQPDDRQPLCPPESAGQRGLPGDATVSRHAVPAGVGPAQSVRRIGKYEVRRRLGTGGQANTLLAFDPDLQRHVVIKLYHQLRSEADREVVLREGRALARVRSRYVAQCFGAERLPDGTPYLVMEYVSGRSLLEVARHRQLTPEQAVELVAQVAEGLAAVHACGLLHRDIKPGNILVGDDGIPRLIDFGLAGSAADAESGRIQGTPAYMAPEQARGETERIDPRSDLFGLGAVLYWLLTGQAPFDGPTQIAAWDRACKGHIVPVEELNRRVPRWIRTICHRCLAPAPEARFESASELARAIRQYRRAVKRRRIWVAAAAVVLAASATGLAVFRPGQAEPDGSPPSAPPRVNTAPTAGAVTSQQPPVAVPDVDVLDPGRSLRQDFGLTLEVSGVRASADRPILLRAGDSITLQVRADQDCHVAVWWIDPNGQVTQIFPNRYETDTRIRGGEVRTIPGNDRYVLRATPSSGLERFYVVASTRPWQAEGGVPLGPYVAFRSAGELNRWQDQLRGVLIEPKSERSQVAELMVPFRVQPVAEGPESQERGH